MAGSGFSDYVPEEKFLGPPSPKNLATPLLAPIHTPLPLLISKQYRGEQNQAHENVSDNAYNIAFR